MEVTTAGAGDDGYRPGEPGYPSSWEFDGLLANGEPVLIRPVGPGDRALIAAIADDRDGPVPAGAGPPDGLDTAVGVAEVEYRDRMAFLAIASDQPVGVVAYHRKDPAEPVAEVTVTVAGGSRHLGVATLLFESLVAYARTCAIARFEATVPSDRTTDLDVLESTGLVCSRTTSGGTVRLSIDIASTPEYRAGCDEREATAEAASIAAVLRPRSIAVVGAGRHPGSVGHEVMRSLLAGDFSGTVYPVNPLARAVCGVAAGPSLSSLPEAVDLAIIAVPSSAVPRTLDEAASLGVRAVIIISSGFGETGRSGAAVEAELLRVARRRGIRIVGPNCLGVVNTDPQVRMTATFAAVDPLPGEIALVSQSGAVGIVLAGQARDAGLGLSNFVSVGNSLDVSANDLLCWFERDDRTSVIALYLESVGNPRKFARIARRVGARKPIVALKAGGTAAGARGARSHTAAAATPQVMVSALLQSAGVIKVDRLEELFDVSALLAATPLPAGNRIGLVGNSGGPLILAADGCEMGGLRVPELSETTRRALRTIVDTAGAVGNPVDITADGGAPVLEQVLETVLGDPDIDAVMVVATELVALPAAAAREVVDRVARRSGKPVVACLLGTAPGPGTAGSPAASPTEAMAAIPSPERAAVALAKVCSYAGWRRSRPTRTGSAWRPPDAEAVREIIGSELARNGAGGWVDLDRAAGLMAACGVPMLTTLAARSAEEAAAVAASVGFPVVLKARSGDIIHKSDVGGVALDLPDAPAVRRAFDEMADRFEGQMHGAVLQPMAGPGVEAIVGLASDPDFGPVAMVGLGGIMTDLLGDRAFGVPPFEAGAAEAMVASLKAAPLLDGFRGAPPVDRRALVAILETVAHVAEDLPELVELDLNPVVVGPDGASVVDCKVRLAPQHGGPGPLFRSLGRPRGA